jgi:N-dimethylarginine dimethylaminohydrolase
MIRPFKKGAEMDSSKFNLWRALFAFCHIDGHVSPEEKKWMDSKLDSLQFTQEQKDQLHHDYNHPPVILELLPLITKPSDRSFLVDQMRVLGHLDREFSEKERSKMEIVRQEVLSKLNLNVIEMQVAGVALERDAAVSFPAGSVLGTFMGHLKRG